MASEISKTQIDRLGDRLKKGNITEADLRLLDSYRRIPIAAHLVKPTILSSAVLEIG
jgi:hypothetical protein